MCPSSPWVPASSGSAGSVSTPVPPSVPTALRPTRSRRRLFVGASTGLVVGLVAITPGTGFVPVWASFIIGAFVSPVCYFCVSRVKKRFGYDDALDAFGCHGVGGIYGGIMTGLFGSQSVNPALVSDGLLFGDTKLFFANLVGTVVTIVLGLVGGAVCIFLTKKITPLRVSEKEEKIGLDITQHGERAYPSFNGLDD